MIAMVIVSAIFPSTQKEEIEGELGITSIVTDSPFIVIIIHEREQNHFITPQCFYMT